MKKFTVIFRTLALALFAVAMLSQVSVANDKSSDSCTYKECKIQTTAFSSRCKMKIEGKIMELDGVKEVYLNMDDKVLTVKFDEKKVKKEALVEEIKHLGYSAEVIDKQG